MPPDTESVTVGHVRLQGVKRLLVYCHGKRTDSWPCHHRAEMSVDRFSDHKALRDMERRMRCTKCGWRKADLRPDYSADREPPRGAGWIMPPR